jgi:hypothetical protein
MRVSSTPTPADEPLLVVPRRGQAVMMSSLIFAGTVRNDLSSAMQKLGAHSRAEAVKVAEDKGWL